MRILFLTENFPPESNAAASRVYERALYWIKWGHAVTVLTCAPNFPEGKVFPGYRNAWYQTEDMEGIKVVRVKTFIARNQGVVLRTFDFLSFMTAAVIAGLFQNRPDVVVATSPQFFAAVGGWILSAVRRLPFVFELGDLWPASIKAVGAMKGGVLLRMVEKLELFLYRKAEAVVALTASFKESLVSRGIPAKKIAVVINGVDLSRYAPSGKDPALAQTWGLKDAFVVGYVGTHGMAHALENVLDAATLLREEQGIRFMFVGTGAARQPLMAKAQAKGLSNVIFIPRQAKESMSAYWSLCDVALIHLKNDPAFSEVIPSKIFEAMGMGLPLLLAAPKGEASAIVERERAGMWVPAEQPKRLVEAVCLLARDHEQLSKFAAASQAAAPRYSRERQAREMLAVLEFVLQGDGARAEEALKSTSVSL